MTVIAILPPSLLWAASFSASNDGAKGPLCAIDIRQSKETVRIAAVDGHRCFRCYVPTGSFFVPEEPIRLSPKAFKAPTKQTMTVEIDDSGLAFFKNKLGEITSSVSWLPDPWATSEQTFPNIDQIWPDDKSLSCCPNEFIAIDAAYIADFAKIATKLSSSGIIRMFSDKSASPMVWRTLADNYWLNDQTEETWLEYLLMPLFVRREA
jgi:hypothetical protein